MIILGIETTCDETGVGIVRDGVEVLANVVASSADMHKKYGGVVPEVAAREQTRSIIPVIKAACHASGVTCQDLDAFAVAYGPGLAGSLIVGVETGKTLAAVFEKPLIAVNHLIGHVYANWTDVEVSSVPKVSKARAKKPMFPLVALIVSGGHTDLILMEDHYKYQWLGGTRDDAAGEAFDKVARVLGLGYPGGPEVERSAQQFKVQSSKFKVALPRPMISEDNFDFSFSGLKTHVVNIVKSLELSKENVPAIAWEFQNAICDVLVKKTAKAAQKYRAKSVVVGGGVAANSELRNRMSDLGKDLGLEIFFPSKGMSVDNGAMIATAAYYQKHIVNPLELQANPGLYFA